MYVPFQEVFAAGLIGVGVMKNKKGEVISEGKVLDYCEPDSLTRCHKVY